MTDSKAPAAYWRKLKQCLKAERTEAVINCRSLKTTAANGGIRLSKIADAEQLLRLIRSILSMITEASTIDISEVKKPRLFAGNQRMSRNVLEAENGKPVITK